MPEDKVLPKESDSDYSLPGRSEESNFAIEQITPYDTTPKSKSKSLAIGMIAFVIVSAGFLSYYFLNQNYIDINVAKQEEDTNSILHYYRDIIAFRKKHPVLVYGDYESLDHENPQIYAYRRWNDNHEFIIIHNFSDSNTQWSYIEDTHLYTMVKTNSKNTLSLFEFAPWQTKILKKN